MPFSRKQRQRYKKKLRKAEEKQKMFDRAYARAWERAYAREMHWTTRLQSVFLSGSPRMDPVRTATHLATINLNLPTLTLLARNGQLHREINVYDIYGRTPIFYVVGPHTNMTIFNFLHERGASLDHVDNRGKSIMDYALLHGNFNIMWRLKNIREKDRIYSTILSNIHDRQQAPSPIVAPQSQTPYPGKPRSSRLRPLRH